MKSPRKHRQPRLKKYPQEKEIIFGLGLIPKEGVPEIKIRFNRSSKIFLGKVTTSKDAADFLRKTYPLGSIQLHERFVVLYIDRNNEVLGFYRHTIGGIGSVIAEIKLIFATALASISSGILLAHNHPSGNLSPSSADIEITKKIQAAAKTLEIRLLDHVIVTKTAHFSFADNDLI